MAAVIVRGGIDSLEQEVTIGRHHLVADEPEGQGGHDAGPSPYDYVLAALGT
jgi:putative redox protein